MQPLITSQIDDMDEARMQFIDRLNNHITRLREELRINEVILHSVVKSLSAKTDAMQQLDLNLHVERVESASHRPMVMNKEQLDKMQRVLLGEARDLNNEREHDEDTNRQQ